MDTDLERAGWVAEHFGVDADACYAPDSLTTMLAEQRPDVVCVVTPVMYMKSTILTCCEAGESVKGIQCEKPIGGRLSDADDMVAACDAAGIVFGGGNLQRCIPELQELAARIRAGTYGELIGASLHGFGGEIVGGGVQNLSVLRLLTGAEVTQVQAYRWVANEDDEASRDEARAAGHPKAPPEGLAKETPFDSGANYSAQLTLSNGLTVAASPRAQDVGASAKNPDGFESAEGAAHGGVSPTIIAGAWAAFPKIPSESRARRWTSGAPSTCCATTGRRGHRSTSPPAARSQRRARWPSSPRRRSSAASTTPVDGSRWRGTTLRTRGASTTT